MNIDPNWLIFYSGLGLVILELIIGVDTGFDFLLIGLSLIIGALGGFVAGSYLVAVSVSIVITILYLIFGRKFIKEKLYVSTHKTNIDALIDKEAIVIKMISKNKAGQVKVENEVWRALADKTYKEGEKVKIISVEGVALKVAH